LNGCARQVCKRTVVSAKRGPDVTTRMLGAGILAWLLPGAGHYALGQRGLAAVFFAAITFAYGTGLAIGGVRDSVNPKTNHWLFLAEIGVGSYTLAGFAGSAYVMRTAPDDVNLMSFYPGSDVAQIYLAVGGLLNLLAILDALARAQTGGLPVFHHELVRGTAAERGAP